MSELTLEVLERAYETLRKACPDPQPVGVACCAQVAAELATMNSPVTDFAHLPVLVDPRMSRAVNEVYTDAALWRKRCKEQEDWEASR